MTSDNNYYERIRNNLERIRKIVKGKEDGRSIDGRINAITSLISAINVDLDKTIEEITKAEREHANKKMNEWCDQMEKIDEKPEPIDYGPPRGDEFPRNEADPDNGVQNEWSNFDLSDIDDEPFGLDVEKRQKLAKEAADKVWKKSAELKKAGLCPKTITIWCADNGNKLEFENPFCQGDSIWDFEHD